MATVHCEKCGQRVTGDGTPRTVEQVIVTLKRHRGTAEKGTVKLSVTTLDALIAQMQQAKATMDGEMASILARAAKVQAEAAAVRIGKCPKHPQGSRPSDNCSPCRTVQKVLDMAKGGGASPVKAQQIAAKGSKR